MSVIAEWLPGKEAPEWLDGSLPGDFGAQLSASQLRCVAELERHLPRAPADVPMCPCAFKPCDFPLVV